MMGAEPTVGLTVSSPIMPPENDNVIASDQPDTVVLVFRCACVNLTLEMGQEIILGRIHPSNLVNPQVDLTAYGGFVDGISRLHAMLTRDETGWFLTDLESSNGTWVNGRRLAPHTPYRLIDDSDIRFTHVDVRIKLPAEKLLFSINNNDD